MLKRYVLIACLVCSTSDHNKQVILSSMTKLDGTVRVVLSTTALGMGIDFVGLDTTIHCGASRSREWKSRAEWTTSNILGPFRCSKGERDVQIAS